jgi:hypothetical protein
VTRLKALLLSTTVPDNFGLVCAWANKYPGIAGIDVAIKAYSRSLLIVFPFKSNGVFRLDYKITKYFVEDKYYFDERQNWRMCSLRRQVYMKSIFFYIVVRLDE